MHLKGCCIVEEPFFRSRGRWVRFQSELNVYVGFFFATRREVVYIAGVRLLWTSITRAVTRSSRDARLPLKPCGGDGGLRSGIPREDERVNRLERVSVII